MAEKGLRTVVQHARQLVALDVAGSLSDRELLDRYVRCRDEAAFTALVQRHTAMVLGVCRRVLKHGQDAEDAGQATFLVLARTATSIHKRTALASWLYGVAYRISRKMHTAQARRRARRAPGGTGPCNPTHDATWREVQAALDEALMSLAEKYRAPLVLCYLEERTRDEAAQLLGLTLSTLRGRLERGRGQVRADLARRGITLSGGLLLAALTADTGSAAVPAAFAAAAVRAAFARSVGPAAARVALLADGAVKTVAPIKIVIAFALLVVLGLGAGAGMIGQPNERADEPATDSVQLAPAAEAQPPQAERRDRYGDPLPPDAVARLGTIRFRPGGHVDSVAFMPDGKQLVAFGPENDLSVWDAATGKELLRHHTAETGKGIRLRRDALLTPDGRHVVTLERSFDKGEWIRIRDRVDLKLIREFAVESLDDPRLTPDGKHLIALRSDDHSDVEIWDLEAGKRVRSWRVNEAGVWRLDLARDGKTVATAGADTTIRVWDVATGRLIREIAGLAKAANILALAPNGELVATASFSYDPSELRKFGPFKVFPWDNRIHIWDVASGKQLCQLQMEARGDYGDHPPTFHSAMFAPDGKHLVTVCSDGALRIWDARTGKLQRQVALGQRSVMRLAFSPDGQTLAIGTSGIRLLDWATGKDKHPEFGHVYAFSTLALTPDGRTVVTCDHGPMQVWDATTGQLRRQLAGHDPTVIERTALGLLPDGQTLLSAGTDKTLRLWDLATGQERRRTAVSFIGLPMAVTGDGALVALVHEDLSIRLIETATGKERLRIPVGADQFNPAVFTADGRTLIVWHIDHTAGVWDLATGKEMRRIAFPERRNPTTPDHEWYTGAVSPDGRFIGYRSSDGRLALYEIATGRQFRLMEGLAKDGVGPFAFSPDDRSLAWGDRGQARVHVLELATGKERMHFDGHHGSIHGIAYAADGRTLVSSSVDTTALVWDVTRSRSAKGAALDPDAAWLALAQDDAATAYRVMCSLATTPNDAVALLQQRIVPAPRPDEKRLATLIADLDSPQFEVRDAAGKELAKLGETAVPACRAAIQTAASIETRRRLQGLIDQQADVAWTFSPERLRLLRSVEVLEMAATAECRALLARLADGAREPSSPRRRPPVCGGLPSVDLSTPPSKPDRSARHAEALHDFPATKHLTTNRGRVLLTWLGNSVPRRQEAHHLVAFR